MSKKRGVSAEEKRTRMLQLFHESKDFFQLKELEKIAPKEKGIIAQSVKDVVQSLVDDGLVETDKIGTSVYFWSYPSKTKVTKKRQLAELEEKLEQVTKKLKTASENLEKAKQGREDTEERRNTLLQIKELKKAKEELDRELDKHKDNDPEVWNKKKEEAEKAKEAANRWTDNIFSVKTWCKNKFNIEEETLEKHFGISPELDYID